MQRYDGKIALITGATGGIGQALAARLRSEGAQIVATDVSQKALDEIYGSADNVVTQVVDVTNREQLDAAVALAVETFGGLDVVYANAGIEGSVAPIAQQEDATYQKVFAVNVLGVAHTIQAATPALIERGGGAIVITSSVAGLTGSPNMAPYVVSKHAVLGLSRCAALELAEHKIRVNTVHPGPIANRMMESIEEMAAPGAGDQVRAGFTQMIPMRRYGQSEEVAKIMAFLGSEDASYCTGGVYRVDGGMSAT